MFVSYKWSTIEREVLSKVIDISLLYARYKITHDFSVLVLFIITMHNDHYYGLYMEMGFLSAVIAEIVRPKLHL